MKLFPCSVLLMQRYVKLTQNFSARPFFLPKKANELRTYLLIKSWINIMHGSYL